MTFTLECPSCAQSLEAETAWANQQVDCPSCGNPFTIPAPTVAPVARIAPPPLPVVSAVRLWNPNVAANWSILFGPVFGTFLHYLNWRQLGESGKAAAALVWVIISVVWIFVLALIVELFPGLPLMWPLAVGFLVLWYVLGARKQIAWVKERHADQYEKRSWLVPIGVAFIALFLLTMVSVLSNAGFASEPQPATAASVSTSDLPAMPLTQQTSLQLAATIVGRYEQAYQESAKQMMTQDLTAPTKQNQSFQDPLFAVRTDVEAVASLGFNYNLSVRRIAENKIPLKQSVMSTETFLEMAERAFAQRDQLLQWRVIDQTTFTALEVMAQD